MCILWQSRRPYGGDGSRWILFSAGFHPSSPQCVDEDLSSTLPGAGDASSVQWREEERALVATFQKPPNSEMILKISLSSFETIFGIKY